MNAKKIPHEGVMPKKGPKGPAEHGPSGDMPSELAEYLADPPKDLLRQAEKCAQEGGTDSRLFKPLVSSVAYGVFGTAAGRCDEVSPGVEAWLCRLL